MYFFFVTNHCYVACLYDFTSVVMQMLQRNGDPYLQYREWHTAMDQAVSA